jgi:hypothetical protein
MIKITNISEEIAAVFFRFEVTVLYPEDFSILHWFLIFWKALNIIGSVCDTTFMKVMLKCHSNWTQCMTTRSLTPFMIPLNDICIFISR